MVGIGSFFGGGGVGGGGLKFSAGKVFFLMAKNEHFLGF
jgi:hypothetical protein